MELKAREANTRTVSPFSCDVFFFFSSRRRHTRYWRDWSSDVCSSDLEKPEHSVVQVAEAARPRRLAVVGAAAGHVHDAAREGEARRKGGAAGARGGAGEDLAGHGGALGAAGGSLAGGGGHAPPWLPPPGGGGVGGGGGSGPGGRGGGR